jgi:hypothetical protein
MAGVTLLSCAMATAWFTAAREPVTGTTPPAGGGGP